MFEYGRQESEYPDSEATDGNQDESDSYHVWHGHRRPSYPSASEKNTDGNNKGVPSSSEDSGKAQNDKTPVATPPVPVENKAPAETVPVKTEPSATVTPPAPAENAGNVQEKASAAEKKDPDDVQSQESADKRNKGKNKDNNRDKSKNKKEKRPVKAPAETGSVKIEPSATVTPPAPAGNAGNVQEKAPEAEKKEPADVQSQEVASNNGVAKGITAGQYSKYKFTPAKSGRYRIEIMTELDGWGVNMSLITTTQYASWDANPALQNTSKAYDESGKAVKNVVTGFMEVDLTTDAVYELFKKDGSDFTILNWTLLN